jgi:predicted DNA-binding antitoxin AbrB/MazE fold protein
MTFQTDAIYEGGVLRPLSPLNLSEHAVVSLSISTEATVATSDEGLRQREVLSKFIAKMEALPNDVPNDGLTNRDHDKLIYGS